MKINESGNTGQDIVQNSHLLLQTTTFHGQILDPMSLTHYASCSRIAHLSWKVIAGETSYSGKKLQTFQWKSSNGSASSPSRDSHSKKSNPLTFIFVIKGL